MFRNAVGQHGLSLMPASEFAQKKFGIMPRFTDVVHDDRAAKLAGVLDDDVAKAHDSLGNARRDGHVLNFAQRDVLRLTSYQAFIDLELGVGDGVPNHVAPDVVVSRNQEEG